MFEKNCIKQQRTASIIRHAVLFGYWTNIEIPSKYRSCAHSQQSVELTEHAFRCAARDFCRIEMWGSVYGASDKAHMHTIFVCEMPPNM